MSNQSKYNLFFCSIAFFLLLTDLHAQHYSKAELTKKVQENGALFKTNIDSAFKDIDVLLKNSVSNKDEMSELVLLDRICRYRYAKNDLDKLVEASDKLYAKAVTYKIINYEAMSYVYMAETYSMNHLSDKAIDELKKAIKVLERGNSNDPKIFYAKSNVLISLSNIYNDKKEYRKAAEKMQEAIKSYKGEKNSKSFRRFQSLNYSNLASIYLHLNIDSAEYFVEKSLSVSTVEDSNSPVMALNYSVLGRVFQEKKMDAVALKYYLKAEKINDNTGELQNTRDTYSNIVTLYKNQGDTLSAKRYEEKLRTYDLVTLQSKYNSLHKVLDKDEDAKNGGRTGNNTVLFIIAGVAAASLIMFILLKQSKNKALQANREDSGDATENFGEYDNLIQMIGRDDSSFIFNFENIFPNFSKKLLEVNPSIVQSEIEFCALLKMKLPTKKIAQLTFIEPRTVQNKKHRIRKKLNIPASMDIYSWFDVL